MKKIITACILCYSSIATLSNCKTKKTTSAPLPPIIDLSGSSPAYQEYIKKEYPKGAVLFQKYCASCHGIFNATKENVPYFSKVKLDAYNLAFLAGDTTNHAVAKGITQPDFELIMLFLTYRSISHP